MEDISDENIKVNCPMCNAGSHVFEFPLYETENFRVVCDGHAIIEGHILIIPKRHVSCIGEYTTEELEEFVSIYNRVRKFVKEEFGSEATFEHGIVGQTVYHSHGHVLPFTGTKEEIVPEGDNYLSRVYGVEELKDIFVRDKGYLFFSINSELWVVDTTLGAPRFFRDRFANALGVPDKGNWKTMHENVQVMNEVRTINKHSQEKFATWGNNL